MNCREFETIVRDISRGETQPLNNGARMGLISARGAAHAGTCVHCAARLAEEQHLNSALNALSLADSHLNPPAPAELNLRVAFRRKYPVRRPWRTAFWLGPVYVGGVAILAVFFMLNHARHTPATPPVSAQVSRPGSPSGLGLSDGQIPAPLSVSAGGNVHSSGNPAAAIRDASHSRVASSAPAADEFSASAQSAKSADDSFVMLPYAGGLAPGESASVVRVALSVPALASWGVSAPADAVSDDETVADLVVGEDGTPRAVHFIH